MNANSIPADAFDAPAPSVPPALASEQVVLGSILLDPASFDRVSDTLRAEHFLNRSHRLVFAEMGRQLGAGLSIDIVTLAEALAPELDGRNAALALLNDMAQFVPSAAGIVRHARIVIEAARARSLLAVSSQIGELACDAAHGIDERIDQAQGLLAALNDQAPRHEWVAAYEGMTAHTAVLEDRAEGRVSSWPTGLADLDDQLEGGLRPGGLYIIGARPSMGKTALGMSIGLFMARSRAVGMLSMEMPHPELRDRMTAMLGRVSLSTVMRPAHSGGLQWDRVLDGVEQAKALRFFVSDQGGLTIQQVRAKARQLRRTSGLDVLVVDYIGLMNGLDARQSRAYQLEEISRGLKSLAKELDIAVLCLAQVNRKVEERADATPALSDLRDSGAIEQDADVVMFVHRPIQAKPDRGPEWTHYARLSVAKNRQGRCGWINLFYQGDQVRFDNWAGPPPADAGSAKAAKAGVWRGGFQAGEYL